MGIQVNTKLYGMYKPWKKLFGDKIEAIRHVVTPSVTANYAPDFGASRYGYYENISVYRRKNGEVRTVEYSPFAGQAFSAPRVKGNRRVYLLIGQ